VDATVDDVVMELVRFALGTASCSDGIGPIDAGVVVRAAQLGVLEWVITAAATVGLTDEAAAMVASGNRTRALRGAQAETVAWRIHRLLRDAGIASLMLKGVALGAMTGRSAGERAGVDTDVLVRPVDWPRVHEVLLAAGYTLDTRCPAPRGRDSLTRFLTFSNYEAAYAGLGGPVDVHWRLGPGHMASLSVAALFERAVEVNLAGGTVATLDPDAMLAHVALHGAKDSWHSARTLVDAYLLVTVAGAAWTGAESLVGRSTAVLKAKAAVESAILGATTSRAARFDTAATRDSLPSFLRHRVALTPTPASVAAVAAGMVLPRQVVVRSALPRRLWWLLIAPRTSRAVWWGVRAAAARAAPPRGRTTAIPSAAGSAPARPSMLHRCRRDAIAVARDLAAWYAGTSSGADTYRVARRLHVRTAGTSSAALFGVMRAIPGATDHTPRSEVRRAAERSGQALDELRERGLTVIEPVLDDHAVERLRAFAEHVPAKLVLADGRVVDGTYSERPPETTFVSVPGTFTWANGEVQHLMASGRLHDLALARFGLAPVVHLPTLYWSCVPATPGARAGESLGRAARFHLDYDGVRSIRVHLYVTNVDSGSAPMEYVLGSHRVGALHGREFRNADNGLNEVVVTGRFGASAGRAITGPAGTTFVTDPRGLHRATPPRDHDRLFLVVAVRAGAFAGAVNRRRAVPVRDDDFGRMLEIPLGPLRLFEAIADDSSSGAPTLRVARFA
jgi:hypothetical protein